jgi:hypothetical protein
MMKLTPLILALLGASNAIAYDPNNPCNLPSPPPPVVYTDFLTHMTIDCAPWPFQGFADSASTTWDFYQTGTGYVAAWYCKGTDGKWGYQMASITNTELNANGGAASYFGKLSTDIVALQVANPASSPAQIITEAAKSRVNTAQNNEAQAAAWCPAWPSIWAKWPEPKNIPVTPPTTFTVKSTPTFQLKSGALVPLRSLAKIGATCTCLNPPTVINAKTYCTFTGAIASNVVAECGQ